MAVARPGLAGGGTGSGGRRPVRDGQRPPPALSRMGRPGEAADDPAPRDRPARAHLRPHRARPSRATTTSSPSTCADTAIRRGVPKARISCRTTSGSRGARRRAAAARPDAARQLDGRPRRAGVRGPAPGSGRPDRRRRRRTRAPAEHRRRVRAPRRAGSQRVGDSKTNWSRSSSPRTGGRPSRCCARTRTSASSRGPTDAWSGSAIRIS